jgi:hypothetical protein
MKKEIIMQWQMRVRMVCLIGVMILGSAGCGIWPVMTNEDGRRTFTMGKSDQVLWPWATPPVHLNEHFSIAYRQAIEGQILNPQAGNSLKPVVGIDGQSSQVNMKRFKKMFEEPPYAANSSGGGGEIIFSSGGK